MDRCSNLVTAPDTDYACVLPAGHAGHCDLIDAMGMCLEHKDCRATRALPYSDFIGLDWSAFRTARANAIEHDPRCPTLKAYAQSA